MSMRNKYLIVLLALPLSCWMALGQSRGGNWPTFGGDALRSGWASTDASINPNSVKDLQLLWKLKLEAQARGSRQVMPPVILGRLISYRGFRELGFVATNADMVYSLDIDLGTIFWTKHLEYSTQAPQIMTSTWRCPGGLTAMPTMPVPAPPRGAAAGRGAPAAAAIPPAPGQAGGQRGSPFIGGPASVYAISSDGRLHRLNTSTGDDMTPPISVIPANARATNLMMMDNVIYTVTSHECGGAPDAVWAIDLSVNPVNVRSFALNGASGLGGAAIGSDGTVYLQTGDGDKQWSNKLLALTPRELKLKDHYSSFARNQSHVSLGDDVPVTSPLVFSYNNRDVVASACRAAQLCLLDSASLGGAEHETAMYRTPPLNAPSNNLNTNGIWGSLSSWQDADGTRWILAPVNGPPAADLKASTLNGPVSNGFIAAFKVQERAGKTTLELGWISRDLQSPVPPVVVNGVVFALSAGEFTRPDEKPKGSTRATLYALDAKTGKELYSSKNLITGPAALTGLSTGTGRVYFGGVDGTVYAFGMYMEH
jgi:outer membrane protein assembly factor BamB